MDGVRLTGLWRQEREDGTTYLSGGLGSGKLLVVPVAKQGDNSPDFVAYLVPSERREGQGQGQGGGGTRGRSSGRPAGQRGGGNRDAFGGR